MAELPRHPGLQELARIAKVCFAKQIAVNNGGASLCWICWRYWTFLGCQFERDLPSASQTTFAESHVFGLLQLGLQGLRRQGSWFRRCRIMVWNGISYPLDCWTSSVLKLKLEESHPGLDVSFGLSAEVPLCLGEAQVWVHSSTGFNLVQYVAPTICSLTGTLMLTQAIVQIFAKTNRLHLLSYRVDLACWGTTRTGLCNMPGI